MHVRRVTGITVAILFGLGACVYACGAILSAVHVRANLEYAQGIDVVGITAEGSWALGFSALATCAWLARTPMSMRRMWIAVAMIPVSALFFTSPFLLTQEFGQLGWALVHL
jgi:hypothetical protein